ncbi:MAG: family 43 glycosylhydrolase, partial [Clostridiales bacterium]|nr:family 43 glycosylhydrolase [Clostridiales bacterium]
MSRTMKIFGVLLCAVILLTALPANAAAGGTDMNNFIFPVEDYGIDMSVTKKTEEINLRDPFVVVYGKTYFMYGTGAARGRGYGCYVSRDLENWAGPVNVFTAPEGFEGTDCFWAPECHYYNGSFYLFATYYSETTKHRGVAIFKADTPLGPFVQISDGHATSSEWDAIDGTLYVDEAGQPWMVFVHEWTSMPGGIGDFSAAKLSGDLSHFISEPISLFKADAPAWTTNGVTDGCFLYKSSGGKLLMLWSGYDKSGYCVAVAQSSDGTVGGEWTQQKRIYTNEKP